MEDEQSLTYVAFAACLERQKGKYQAEKDARYALLKKQDSDDEEDVVADRDGNNTNGQE